MSWYESLSERLTEWIAWSLGYEDATAIESWRVTFGAAWAHDGPAWVLFGCLALAAVAWVFYLRFQSHGSRRRRLALAAVRGSVLCLLLLILADPILEIQLVSHPKPQLWVLFDGTESMAIADKLPAAKRQAIADAVDLPAYQKSGENPPSEPVSRAEFVRALVAKPDENLLAELSKKFRLRGYRLDTADGVQAMNLMDDDEFDGAKVVPQLTTDGKVTALGTALNDLATRHASGNVAGLLMFSDFNRNAGPLPEEAAKKLGVPIFTVGVGATTAVDLSIDHLDAPVKMKKAEQSTLTVTLRQQELENTTVHVRVTATKAGDSDTVESTLQVGAKDVLLTSPKASVEFPFTPKTTGRYLFVAEVGHPEAGADELQPLEEEIVRENNRAEREVTIIDDFMRLLYVAYEPTWEWRFVKEVFHRDELVGLRGFRTFLRSSDPIVRERNELFVPNLTLPRSEFFKNDVIFLGDMPADALSTRFCEMTKEFVSQFGGGLVVIAGPRFGPGQLAKTPLADMLPVFVDPDARIRDARPFQPALTPFADTSTFDFMQLGGDEDETELAWGNLGRVPWYQPVQAVEPSATTVLAEHPTDTCVNGRTKQPLIAVRRYGRGEVVYIAFNEMWRLRRRYGEKYYRNFWGPLIKRLGLSHALGQQKRFVVRTDRKEYQADDKLLLTVEAYDQDFNPLSEEDIEKHAQQRSLEYELLPPESARDSRASDTQGTVTMLRPGVFEARIPVFHSGEYAVRVRDPIAEGWSDAVHFQVTSVSAERRSPVRNVAVQESLARETGGRGYELETADEFLSDFTPPTLTERTTDIRPLWSTWPCFALLIVLMLGEWWARKMTNLA